MMASVMTKRNREKFVHDGHMFTFERLNSSRLVKFWRCDRRDSHDCKARIHTSVATNEVVKVVSNHCHGGGAAEVEAASVCTVIVRRAEETMEIPAVILNEELQGLNVAVRGQLPNMAALRQRVRRRRTAIEAAPPQPHCLASVMVPENYRTYGNGERFLLYDSGLGDENRILIFGRESNESWSSQMRSMYADGTFSIAPRLFAQVYVLLAKREEFAIPVLYALLPNKQERTYRRMLEAIRGLWPQLAPQTICTDFEKAAMNAVRAVFPGTQILGCFFHLVRSMKRQLTEQRLLARCRSDSTFQHNARMIVALAFLPPAIVQSTFDQLAAESPDSMEPILNWFERTYVGCRNRRGVRRAPLFPPGLWSVHERTLMRHDRTNNFVEAAHRRMKLELGADHPTLWKFIEGMRKVQAGRDQHYEEFIRGDEPPRKRLRFIRADERIRRTLDEGDIRSPVEILRGIAHCFDIN